jgi:hypothetical protein
MPTILF